MASKKSTILFVNYLELSENFIKLGVILIILFFLLHSGSVFETSYSSNLVELYAFPWWRLLVVCLVLIGAWWCPRIGILLALAAFFYLNDMHSLTNPVLLK